MQEIPDDGVTRNRLKSQNGAGWHLIPYRICPRSEFFSQAYKNWHIMWGINLGLDWPPLARGSNFHTIHTPTRSLSFLSLDNGRIFFHGLIDFILFFYTGLKNLGSLVSQIFFCLQPGVNGQESVCHEPCSKTNFLIIYFRWGEGVPTSILGSQPIIWLLSSPPWCPATWGY